MGDRNNMNDPGMNSRSIQCYLCGRSVTKHYITERIEPRIATRYHGKRVQICIYCAEEWDEEFPGTKPEDASAENTPPELNPEESTSCDSADTHSEPSATAPPLTKRQAERLAWYHNVAPVQGYDVKSAILRDDAFGAVAHEADRLGLSYGYYMVRKELQAKKAKSQDPSDD